MTSDDSGPRRDVKNGDYECSHCGGKASNLLGEEHIWECSEAVPIEELEALAERMENPGNPPWLGTTSAQELREVIEQYE